MVLQNIVPGILSAPGTDGCRWFQSLNDETRRRLTWSLRAWEDILRSASTIWVVSYCTETNISFLS
ncbi:hypothetical protein V8C40DRAFT_255877, partial [Trichoderma camerunense]